MRNCDSRNRLLFIIPKRIISSLLGLIAMDALEILTYAGARKLYETLRSSPQRQFSINELSRVSGLPFTTTWKLVQKFEKADVVDVALIGRSRAVRYKAGPFSKLLGDIVRLSVSPQALSIAGLKRALGSKKEVAEAYLFGSVASKSEKLGSDIDIALLLKRKIDLPSLISDMHEKYGVNVVPLPFDSKGELESFLEGKKAVRLA